MNTERAVPMSRRLPRGSAARSAPPLLDDIMPAFEFRSRHAIVVDAPRVRVAEVAQAYRLDGTPLVRFLFWLRGLGSTTGTVLGSARAAGFTVLAEKPGEEVVLGVVGRFWTLDERNNMESVRDARAFLEFDRPGWAKAAVNIRFEALTGRATRLSTETRVQCVDAAAHRRFRLYWALIKPFSAWIRRDLLRGIRRVC